MKNILILIATLISYSAFASNVDFPDYTCNVSKYSDDTVFGPTHQVGTTGYIVTCDRSSLDW